MRRVTRLSIFIGPGYEATYIVHYIELAKAGLTSEYFVDAITPRCDIPAICMV